MIPDFESSKQPKIIVVMMRSELHARPKDLTESNARTANVGKKIALINNEFMSKAKTVHEGQTCNI